MLTTPAQRSNSPTTSSPPSESGNVEIPETPPAISEAVNIRYHWVERVLCKRATTDGDMYCVATWIESTTADPEVNHLLRKYDEKVAQKLARRERLSTLRSTKRSPAHDIQNSKGRRKRPRTSVLDDKYQSSTYPSRQVEVDVIHIPDLDPDDLQPIQTKGSSKPGIGTDSGSIYGIQR